MVEEDLLLSPLQTKSVDWLGLDNRGDGVPEPVCATNYGGTCVPAR